MKKNKRISFQTPYQEYKHLIGKEFSIVGYNPSSDPDNSETYTIEIEEGLFIEALPEEIFSEIGWEPSYTQPG